MLKIALRLEGLQAQQTKREKKGESYIGFPSEYCIVDIETTGLSPEWDHIIEIGAIKYSEGHAKAEFQSLVQPPEWCINGDNETPFFVDEYITELTGITNDMLRTAPQPAEAIKAFANFLEGNIIVGYNVNFDINFLYDAYIAQFDCPLMNSYIDVYRMARKLYPHLGQYRLCEMAEHLGYANEQQHRALSDCLMTAFCYEKFYSEALKQYKSIELFVMAFQRTLRASEIQGDEAFRNIDSPLYNQRCVFTGKLEKFTRKEAMQIVADLGGINEDNVTRGTNYLILGNNEYQSSIKNGKSAKQKKAEMRKLAGQNIEILSETAFYDMLTSY